MNEKILYNNIQRNKFIRWAFEKNERSNIQPSYRFFSYLSAVGMGLVATNFHWTLGVLGLMILLLIGYMAHQHDQ